MPLKFTLCRFVTISLRSVVVTVFGVFVFTSAAMIAFGRVVGLSGVLGDGRLDLGQLEVLGSELASQEVDLARRALREEDAVGCSSRATST